MSPTDLLASQRAPTAGRPVPSAAANASPRATPVETTLVTTCHKQIPPPTPDILGSRRHGNRSAHDNAGRDNASDNL